MSENNSKNEGRRWGASVGTKRLIAAICLSLLVVCVATLAGGGRGGRGGARGAGVTALQANPNAVDENGDPIEAGATTATTRRGGRGTGTAAGVGRRGATVTTAAADGTNDTTVRGGRGRGGQGVQAGQGGAGGRGGQRGGGRGGRVIYGTNAPTNVIEYAAFINERNIFNPGRVPIGNGPGGGGRPGGPDPTNRVYTLQLLGTIRSDKGVYALFDGNNQQLRGTAQIGQTISGMKLTEITMKDVKLESGGKVIDLPVGGTMTKTGDFGEWQPPKEDAYQESDMDLTGPQLEILMRLMNQRLAEAADIPPFSLPPAVAKPEAPEPFNSVEQEALQNMITRRQQELANIKEPLRTINEGGQAVPAVQQ